MEPLLGRGKQMGKSPTPDPCPKEEPEITLWKIIT
jgi:hypothetical protein